VFVVGFALRCAPVRFAVGQIAKALAKMRALL
jgi:hypothetical protein